MSASAALLLLADARFPAGAHAHSGGMEPSHGAGDVRTEADVESFVRGRLATSGRVDAAFAARACELAASGAAPDAWVDLDTELAARTPSPRLRATARTLGRQLLRAGERTWPSAAYATVRLALPAGPMQPLVLGAVATAAGAKPADAALCSLHHLVAAATTAAVRLTGFDPFAMTALAARLVPELEHLAERAAATDVATSDLPATTSPLADVLAEHHATWEVRLFAS